MIAVIFEVQFNNDGKQQYLDIASQLLKELVKIDGFISVERYVSLTESDKILSISFWRDEEAIRNWRNRKNHRQAQEMGRATIFQDYRLRIANVLRDYSLQNRDNAPEDSRQFHKE